MLEVSKEVLVVVTSLLLRWSCSYHGYSGESQPPIYGDYEAQRHWMEVTVNLPVEEWYFSTENNDLMYWGLDYPPLTAYHSWLNGKIASFINPEWVALNSSRGYESKGHKYFMRMTVLASDLLIFIPAVLMCAPVVKHCLLPAKSRVSTQAYVTVLDFLIYPGLILVDHGHFQYNCVSLGLALFAISAALKQHLVLASIFYVMAFSYKQMLLYYALPFFFYILGHCLFLFKKSKIEGLKTFLGVALSVIATFFMIWYPFLTDLRQFQQVLHRIFPVSRGLFEDKVANIWCYLNLFYKFKLHISPSVMAAVCSILTLIFSLPSCLHLFLHPSQKSFVLSLINVSMAFFLFSFQVHEKTILVVAVPVLTFYCCGDFHCLWFCIISTFSMFPLLYKDGLLVPYYSLTVLFILIKKNFVYSTNRKWWEPISSHFETFSWITLSYISAFGCVILSLLHIFVSPPAALPDLFPLLIAMYSTGHFVYFFGYFYGAQFSANDRFALDLVTNPKYD